MWVEGLGCALPRVGARLRRVRSPRNVRPPESGRDSTVEEGTRGHGDTATRGEPKMITEYGVQITELARGHAGKGLCRGLKPPANFPVPALPFHLCTFAQAVGRFALLHISAPLVPLSPCQHVTSRALLASPRGLRPRVPSRALLALTYNSRACRRQGLRRDREFPSSRLRPLPAQRGARGPSGYWPSPKRDGRPSNHDGLQRAAPTVA